MSHNLDLGGNSEMTQCLVSYGDSYVGLDSMRKEALPQINQSESRALLSSN